VKENFSQYARAVATSIQYAAQIIERARQVDIGNIDVPVLMRLKRLFEAAWHDGLPFHRDSSPAWFSTHYTLAGLTATTSASSIMNVSRR
jgi:hypothetical protein